MTESDRRDATDPATMAAFLRDSGPAYLRKARLFDAACCRRVQKIMSEEVNRGAVEMAERFADGEANEQELMTAWNEAGRILSEAYTAAFNSASRIGRNPSKSADHATHSYGAAYTTSGPDFLRYPGNAAQHAVAALAKDERSAERTAQATLLRCIFGPLPFRTPSLDPAWRTLSVLSLADAAYSERIAPDPSRPGWLVIDPVRLLVLADALEEAGCDDADILPHCREPSEHVRGCWCLDLLLAKGPVPCPVPWRQGPMASETVWSVSARREQRGCRRCRRSRSIPTAWR
jgi:hypothetical protein